MREIKFRAWDGEKMHYMPNMFVGVGQIGFSNEHYVDLGMYDTEDAEVMQYTGLKDKNGVEIYEGDIVSTWNKLSFPVEFGRWENMGSYEDYEEGYGWFLRDSKEDNRMLDPEVDWYEVIGNIYENPELLERGLSNE